MALKIYGAGMAGMLAAHMLRERDPVIYEQAPALPNNHKALLRFRTDAVSKETGIPFRQVRVTKAVWDGKELRDYATMRDANSYSQKVTGKISERSIMNLEPSVRYVAPEDFIPRMAKGLDIKFGRPMDCPEACISTIPMPALADLCDIKHDIKFTAQEIWTARAELPYCDVFQTVYSPDPETNWYRASITGNILMVEFIRKPVTADGLDETRAILRHILGINFGMGNYKLHHQKFGKLVPVDQVKRKSIILEASDRFGIYSLGRFATWRQILMDDVVHDVNIVRGFLDERGEYARRLHR